MAIEDFFAESEWPVKSFGQRYVSDIVEGKGEGAHRIGSKS